MRRRRAQRKTPLGSNEKALWSWRRLMQVAQVLREECPAAGELPVKISFNPTPYTGKNSLAWCNLSRDRRGRPRNYRIVIRTTVGDRGYPGIRRATFTELRDSLIHEWAHAMSWTANAPGCGDHGPEWGVAYARAYNAVNDE